MQFSNILQIRDGDIVAQTLNRVYFTDLTDLHSTVAYQIHHSQYCVLYNVMAAILFPFI